MDHATPTTNTQRDGSGVPRVSIVVLNYRAKGLLKYCLRGFFSTPLPFSYEIIVVDNASGDGCMEMVQTHFPDVRYIASPENRGYASGNNQGIQAANGEYVLIANPDIVVRPGAVEALVRFMDERPHVAIVGPQLRNPDGSIQDSCYRFPIFWMPLFRRTLLGSLRFAERAIQSYRMDDFDHRTSRRVDWLLGACLLVRKKAIETVGTMDERFFLYFEDIDWCRRFLRKGYEVWYHPEVHMVHFHQRLSAERAGILSIFSFITRVHISSWIKYMWKWRGN